jgi:hypothetical protein
MWTTGLWIFLFLSVAGLHTPGNHCNVLLSRGRCLFLRIQAEVRYTSGIMQREMFGYDISILLSVYMGVIKESYFMNHAIP